MPQLKQTSQKKKTILLIDGNNLAYRSAAVLTLKNSKGEDTSITYGMVQSVRRLIDRFKPFGVIICWDGGRSQFRLNIYPEYKAGKRHTAIRGKLKAELGPQLDTVKRLFHLLGIPQIQIKGVEADDLICRISDTWVGSIYSGNSDVVRVNKISHYDHKSIIASSDHDFRQLVYLDNLVVFNPISGQLIDQERYVNSNKHRLCHPEEYRLFHIVNGDKGDNITGIPGLGEVGSAKFARKFTDWREEVVGFIANRLDRRGKLDSTMGKIVDKVMYNQSKLRLNEDLIDLRKFRVNHRIRISYGNTLGVSLLHSKEVKEFMSELEFDTYVTDFKLWIMPFTMLSIRNFVEKGYTDATK